MNNASTADARGHDRPNDAEPFFPSEGTFSTVVPLSEVGHADADAPEPLRPFDAADAGQPAEADWAREEHRAELKDEEETTLVPARKGRARAERRPWVVTATVIVLSVAAGLTSGTYLIWSAQRAPEAPQPAAQVEAEAPSLPPAPAPEPALAPAKVETVSEPVKDEEPSEVVKDEKPSEVARAPKPEPPAPAASAPRAERPARAEAEAREVTPAPKPARTQSAAPARQRVTTTARRQTAAPAASGRTLPVSSPPPSAKSKKVIQWP